MTLNTSRYDMSPGVWSVGDLDAASYYGRHNNPNNIMHLTLMPAYTITPQPQLSSRPVPDVHAGGGAGWGGPGGQRGYMWSAAVRQVCRCIRGGNAATAICNLFRPQGTWVDFLQTYRESAWSAYFTKLYLITHNPLQKEKNFSWICKTTHFLKYYLNHGGQKYYFPHSSIHKYVKVQFI